MSTVMIIGHFGDESLQSVTYTGTDKQQQQRDKTHTKHKSKFGRHIFLKFSGITEGRIAYRSAHF